MVSNWYENFFRGIVLDFWRKAITAEQTRIEADFLEGVLNVDAGARLLDVPCGNGRLSVELAARGYRMTGVDIASEFIREAQDKTLAAGLDVEWLLGDMRDLPWQAEFDGAFCFGNSFGYMDFDGTREFISSLSRSLKRGARFVLDTATAAESLLPSMPEREWMRVDDILVLIENHYRADQSRLDTHYTFISDGKIERRTSLNWVFTVAEILRMLDEAGLATLSLLSSLDQQPFRLGDHRLLLIAEKV